MSLQDDVAAAFRELNELRAMQGAQHGPQNHDEAQERIAWHVRNIQIIADAFNLDPCEWLADSIEDNASVIGFGIVREELEKQK